MPVTKVTLFFQLTTVDQKTAIPKRVGGWTESWYWTGDTNVVKKNTTELGGLAQRRAVLLPKTASIVAIRYQQVDPPPPLGAELDPQGFAGGALDTDIPQMSLLVKVTAVGVRNTRQYMMRGLPDNMVVTGEFDPSPVYKDQFDEYVKELGNWSIRGHDLTQPRITLVSVTALGVCTTNVNHGLNPDDVVSITRSKQDNTGKLFSGTFQVIDVVDTKHFVIDPGDLSERAQGGKMQKVVVIYPAVNKLTTKPQRVVTRKVGRPFDGYHGRR